MAQAQAREERLLGQLKEVQAEAATRAVEAGHKAQQVRACVRVQEYVLCEQSVSVPEFERAPLCSAQSACMRAWAEVCLVRCMCACVRVHMRPCAQGCACTLKRVCFRVLWVCMPP